MSIEHLFYINARISNTAWKNSNAFKYFTPALKKNFCLFIHPLSATMNGQVINVELKLIQKHWIRLLNQDRKEFVWILRFDLSTNEGHNLYRFYIQDSSNQTCILNHIKH